MFTIKERKEEWGGSGEEDGIGKGREWGRVRRTLERCDTAEGPNNINDSSKVVGECRVIADQAEAIL